MDHQRARILSDRVFGLGFVLLAVSFLHHVAKGSGTDRHGAWLALLIVAGVLTLGGLVWRWSLRRQS